MRLVAGLTGQSGGVVLPNHLRKPFGLAAFAVWQRAQSTAVSSFVGFTDPGHPHAWPEVRGTPRNSHAHACHLFSYRGRLHGRLRSLVAGEFDGTGGDFGYGVATIVSVLSEAFRDHRVPESPRNRSRADNEDPCQSKKMSCIFENIHESQLSLEAAAIKSRDAISRTW